MGGLLDTESCPSVVDDLYWFPKHGLNVRLFLQGTVHLSVHQDLLMIPHRNEN